MCVALTLRKKNQKETLQKMNYEIEADYKIEADFEHAGLRCVVLYHLIMGHRCGYVAVPKHHILYGKHYREQVPALRPMLEKLQSESAEIRDEHFGLGRLLVGLFGNRDDELTPEFIFNVHGGITFAGPSEDNYPIADEAVLWWFGFDAAHAGDRSNHNHDGVHRDLEYMVNECKILAEQLANIALYEKSNKPKETIQ